MEIQKSKNHFTLKEAAEYINFGVQSIYNLIHSRRITFYKAGGKVIFLKKDLDTFLYGNKYDSREEMVTKAAKYL